MPAPGRRWSGATGHADGGRICVGGPILCVSGFAPFFLGSSRPSCFGPPASGVSPDTPPSVLSIGEASSQVSRGRLVITVVG